MQLDGHDRSGVGDGFPIDGRKGCSDVAADHDVFRAWVRTLDREYVRDSGGDVVWRTGFGAAVVAVEPDSRHAREYRVGRALNGPGVVRDVSSEANSL